MKVSEYIEKLEALKNEHGDLEVLCVSWDGASAVVSEPKIDYKAILKGRESKPRFASWFFREEGRQGEKVIRI